MATAAAEPLEVRDAEAQRGEKKSGSFLNPAGNAPAGAPAGASPPPPPESKSLGPIGELCLFAFFVLTRAIHPAIIDASKVRDPETGKKAYGYASGTTVIVMCFLVVVWFQIQAAFRGEWHTIWKKKELQTFSVNGVIYAVGDWLELLSMGKLSGAPYQVLLQSKFIFTALLMLYLKGTQQSRLQWILLISLMLSMSVYMAVSSGSGESNLPLDGMTFALLKVLVSCLGAVVSDKYMKAYKNTPIHIQLVQMGLARFVGSFFLSFIGTTIWEDGFFHGWNGVVFFVSVSFFVKSVSTLYLVALLDSMLKNIGEALAVLVIYAWDQLDKRMLCATGPCTKLPFEIPPLLAVIVVVLIVVSYLDAKTVVEKAKKWDAANK
jgi:hypothetical protein